MNHSASSATIQIGGNINKDNVSLPKGKLWGIVFLILGVFLLGMFCQDYTEVNNKTRHETSEQQEEKYMYLSGACILLILSTVAFFYAKKK